MKRIIAFILFLVFMTFKCLTWVPSAAATGIPAFDAFYYAVLQTLGMAYTNGVEMDLAPAIAEVREAVPDYLQQPDVALKYLLRDYAGKAWDYVAYNWENSTAFEDVSLAETAAIGLANASGVSVPTLQDIVTQWTGKALDDSKNITTPINSNTVSFWNKFNKLYINDYLDRINYVVDDTPPLPDLPASIETCVDTINGSGFNFLRNLENISIAQVKPGYYFYNSLPWSNRSFYTANKADNNINWTLTNIGTTTPIFGTSGIDNIFIVSNNDTYTVTIYNHYDNLPLAYTGGTIDSIPVYGNLLHSSSNGLWGNYLIGDSNFTFTGSNAWDYQTYSGTLDDVFYWLQSKVRNVNIYVDGNIYAIAGYSTPIPQFQSSVPNAVIDTGTDDGKVVANPIYWVVDNNTGTPIDSQINLDKLIDYLKGVIDGTNDDTSVDFGDLVDAGVIEKEDGTAITDADVIAIPIADVIDDSIARADHISIPIAITGTLPPLPPLPPFFPTPDFPEGDPTSGFNGMSVLARIINITNQSLPDELVVTFYGVMFGAIVLGLIKILHK